MHPTRCNTQPRNWRLLLAAAAGLALQLAASWANPDEIPPNRASADPSTALLAGGSALTFIAQENTPLLSSLAPAGAPVFMRDWAQLEDNAILGPHFDASSCGACHVETGNGTLDPVRTAIPVTEAGRRQFQQQVTHRAITGVSPEARIELTHIAAPHQNLSAPLAHAVVPDGQRHPVAIRVAPTLFGWGLLERVNQELYAGLADPQDNNRDGISGRLPAPPQGATVPGFGWKGHRGSIEEQVAAALAFDMGISTKLLCAKPCDAELTAAEFALLVDYVRYLAVPERRVDASAAAQRGEQHFYDAGCGACHTPVLVTSDAGPAALAGQIIWPYSDLLLHDMGPGLSDPGDAVDAAEWRTPPLWGLGLVMQRHPQRGLLHDGRARTFDEAIRWHGGEGAASQKKYLAMSRAARRDLVAFLEAL